MSSLVTAALATVASSAVVSRRATALPASFGLEFVSSDAAINGVRVKYSEGVSSPLPYTSRSLDQALTVLRASSNRAGHRRSLLVPPPPLSPPNPHKLTQT